MYLPCAMCVARALPENRRTGSACVNDNEVPDEGLTEKSPRAGRDGRKPTGQSSGP